MKLQDLDLNGFVEYAFELLSERKAYPLQYSGLENSMDCIVCGVAKSQTRLSDFHFQHFQYIRWGLIFKIYKELIELSGKNTNDLVKK